MAVWLPGFQVSKSGRTGNSYRHPGAPPRFVFHTTEGSGLPDYPYPPHATADPKTKRVWQHVSLDLSAYALAHPSGTVDTNHMKAIQLEIVGFSDGDLARQYGQGDRWVNNFPDSWLRWLGEAVIGPMCRASGVNMNNVRTTYGKGAGFTIASQYSPIRMSASEWTGFGGCCGHQHVPANDHWDPGALNVQRIMYYARGSSGGYIPPVVPSVQEGDLFTMSQMNTLGAWMKQQTQLTGMIVGKLFKEQDARWGLVLPSLIVKTAEATAKAVGSGSEIKIDEDAIVKGVTDALKAAPLPDVEAIVSGLANELSDRLAE